MTSALEPKWADVKANSRRCQRCLELSLELSLEPFPSKLNSADRGVAGNSCKPISPMCVTCTVKVDFVV